MPEPDGSSTIHEGDALEVLRALPDASVDSMVTDPPAGIEFMGKEWDTFRRRTANPSGKQTEEWDESGGAGGTRPFARRATPRFTGKSGTRNLGAREEFISSMAAIFTEALRVLKPGSHALVWALPRTSHWTAAGFEIRDVVTHHFGSGFPKSLNVSKAIDKMARRDYVLAAVALGVEIPSNSLHDWTKAEHSPSDTWWEKFKAVLSDDDWQRIEREVVGNKASGTTAGMQNLGPSGIRGGDYDVTIPATPAARTWDGWGTALKPASEHWILCRVPLIGTVAANVLEHGTGGLNIDGCRVGTQSPGPGSTPRSSVDGRRGSMAGPMDRVEYTGEKGRWPANLILSHAEGCECAGKAATDYRCVDGCPVAELDRQSGESVSPKVTRAKVTGTDFGRINDDGWQPSGCLIQGHGDSGGASRFFYCAKPSTAERNMGDVENTHPTVKAVALMAYLCRLTTPPGGTVIDLFMGSGSTGIAALREGFSFIGIEKDPEYVELAERRIKGDAPLFNKVETITND